MAKNSGQTTLEYILLLGVILLVILGVSRHPLIKNFMEGGDIISELATYMQYTYRHALPGKVKEKYMPDYSNTNHASYQNQGDTRFFGPIQKYP